MIMLALSKFSGKFINLICCDNRRSCKHYVKNLLSLLAADYNVDSIEYGSGHMPDICRSRVHCYINYYAFTSDYAMAMGCVRSKRIIEENQETSITGGTHGIFTYQPTASAASYDLEKNAIGSSSPLLPSSSNPKGNTRILYGPAH